jgi:putative hemolysin
MISIDATLENKFPGLINKPVIGRSLSSFLKYLCHESEFKQFEERYPHLEGFDFVEQVLDNFGFSYRVMNRELQHIPSQGRVVIVANHPIGSLDGLALLKLVSEVRRDVKVVANELLYSIKPLRSLLLPVDNINNRTQRENLRAIKGHLESDGALIIFPAGEVSRFSAKGVRDGQWNSGFLRFANQTKSPILPMFVNARNSMFFYALSMLAKPISTLWLVREMFKQANQHMDVRIGQAIDIAQIQHLEVSPKVRVKLLKKHVYKLAKGKSVLKFRSEYESVAHPENRQELKREIRECELLGETADGLKILLYRYQTNSVIMREIGRLRELTFRTVQEGTGKRRDTDKYDHHYDQLVLWDEERLEIAGAYRMRATAGISHNNIEQTLYTQTLFELNEGFQPFLEQGLELGRSFVQPAYQGKRSLDYLWYGIGAYLKQRPNIRYLFGPVSISASMPDDAKSLLVQFYSSWFGNRDNIARSKTPYLPETLQATDALNLDQEYKEAFRSFKSEMKQRNSHIPTLFKQYTELCEEGGVQFAGFNVDPDFCNCVDGLIMVDLEKMKASKRQRYLGQ